MWHMAGYFDESDDNKRAYSMAGFIGHQHDCVHLDLEWKDKILDKYGLEYFKASELNAGTGQFAKFRDDPNNLRAQFSHREKDILNEIKIASIDVILKADMLIGIGAVIMLPDYYRLYEEYKAIGKALPAPYFFCFQVMLMESGFVTLHINAAISKSQAGVLRPVFDSHDEYSGRGKQLFDAFCKSNPITSSCLLPPHYESDLHYRILQAADNLAYECRRLIIIKEYETHLPERIAMKRLKERVYKVYKLDYQSMKTIMESQSPEEIPFEANIHNAHQLLRELDLIQEKAGMRLKQKLGVRPRPSELGPGTYESE